VPFFFVLPMWLLAVIVGVVMVCLRVTRRTGVYVITMSTFATIASFVLAYGALLAGLWIAANTVDWFRFIALGAYLVAIPVGGLIGAIAGFLMTRKLLRGGSVHLPN